MNLLRSPLNNLFLLMKNLPIWPFLVAAIVIATITVRVAPQGIWRGVGIGVAAIVFPVVPLVGGHFVRRANEKAKRDSLKA
jgi:hypothetical protein